MGFYVLEGRVNNGFLSVRGVSEEWLSNCKKGEKTMGFDL